MLACDPQSPLSGGALLGDRFRMPARPDDDGVFIRSLAAAGGHGALAEHLGALIRLLEAFGFDVVLIETVGAGQGDTVVRDLVDVLVLLLQPETGDDLQWEKAGLLEVADVMRIHKADLPGGARRGPGVGRAGPSAAPRRPSSARSAPAPGPAWNVLGGDHRPPAAAAERDAGDADPPRDCPGLPLAAGSRRGAGSGDAALQRVLRRRRTAVSTPPRRPTCGCPSSPVPLLRLRSVSWRKQLSCVQQGVAEVGDGRARASAARRLRRQELHRQPHLVVRRPAGPRPCGTPAPPGRRRRRRVLLRQVGAEPPAALPGEFAIEQQQRLRSRRRHRPPRAAVVHVRQVEGVEQRKTHVPLGEDVHRTAVLVLRRRRPASRRSC